MQRNQETTGGATVPKRYEEPLMAVWKMKQADVLTASTAYFTWDSNEGEYVGQDITWED